MSPTRPTITNFRSILARLVPSWMGNRLGKNVGFKFVWSMFVPLDIAADAVLQGVNDWGPGSPGATPTALPLIGQSRGIVRGEAESDESYARRLRAWLDTWEDAGSSQGLALAIQSYLANTPTVRIVNRAGFWVSVANDGTITTATAAWNWDTVSNPERSGWWADLWIIVYPCEWPVADTVGATADPSHDVEGMGHLVPPAAVDAILGLVEQWKGAHTWVEAIVWSYDATLFDPADIGAAGNPDGSWAYPCKYVAGAYVPARTGATDGRARYWQPRNG